ERSQRRAIQPDRRAAKSAGEPKKRACNDLIQPMVEKNLAAARKRGATDALLANIRDLGTVSGAFLDSALATIDAEYGNMHNYLKEALQLTDAEKRDLRELYLQ
ncbi:MAG: tyrosine-protein phosphatase, partial [Citrobacter freundii]|nr:tyrosine-protein phosphatase [Citrobacter freundii]